MKTRAVLVGCGGMTKGWTDADARIGTKGSATWNGGEGFKAQQVTGEIAFHDKTRDLDWTVDPADKSGGHTGLKDEFIDCVRTGRTPETHCADSIKSLAMAFAAIESAETGKRIHLTP